MKTEEYKKYNRESILSDKLNDYCLFADENSFIEITEWWNGGGFDIEIQSKNEVKRFQLTQGEWDLLKKLVKQFYK